MEIHETDYTVTETGCWEWNRVRFSSGYARIGDERVTRKIMGGIAGRELGRWEFVLHACDNPPCVNPSHRRIGTPADNAQDREERGRGARSNWTVCVNGHDLTKAENTYPRADRKNPRCRECSKASALACYRRRKAKS